MLPKSEVLLHFVCFSVMLLWRNIHILPAEEALTAIPPPFYSLTFPPLKHKAAAIQHNCRVELPIASSCEDGVMPAYSKGEFPVTKHQVSDKIK